MTFKEISLCLGNFVISVQCIMFRKACTYLSSPIILVQSSKIIDHSQQFLACIAGTQAMVSQVVFKICPFLDHCLGNAMINSLMQKRA